MIEYPICRVCPKCSYDDYVKARPEGVAFAYDRICDSCGTRYRPPTPAWASWIFIVLGGLLCLYMGFNILVGVWIATKAPRPGLLIGGMICPLVLATLGFVAALHGISSLREKVVDPEETDT